MDDLTSKAVARLQRMANAHLRAPVDPGIAPIATAFLEKALALAPDHIQTHLALARACHALGKTDEALHWCQRALDIEPGSIAGRFLQCMLQIPVLYDNIGEIADRRRNYAHCLRNLAASVDVGNPRALAEAEEVIGKSKPFYLPYAAEDDRGLQQLYGAFVCKVLAARHPQWTAALTPPALKRGEPVRVGIVSGDFSRHVVFIAITSGWLSELDRRRFALFGYALKSKPCPELEEAKTCCRQWVNGPLSLEQWCEKIRSDRLHAIIYPEVGMNSMAIKLAGLRLAPVQCMAGGHPVTSGLPTMDYFLSSALVEPPDGAAHYTENLVRLPNMSLCYRLPDFSPTQRVRADFGLRWDAVVYLCIQTLYRYLPQYDEIYPRIALQTPDCQFVFVKHRTSEPISRILARRLERAFVAFGLNWKDYVVFLSRLEFRDYHALQDLGDIYLDSIGWNGGTTTINAIAHDLPIVTLPGRFFRGRLGLGKLTMIGVTDTIAADCNHYVEIAVRLGQDAAWRRDVRERMARNKHKVFNDRKCIEGLETFLWQAAHGEAPQEK